MQIKPSRMILDNNYYYGGGGRVKIFYEQGEVTEENVDVHNGTLFVGPDVDEDSYSSACDVEGQYDCDDSNPAISPSNTEVCGDIVDNDCNGQLDEEPCFEDGDDDGYVSVANGGQDCADDDASIHPFATELCGDGVDQDCDGEVDEGGCE